MRSLPDGKTRIVDLTGKFQPEIRLIYTVSYQKIGMEKNRLEKWVRCSLRFYESGKLLAEDPV